MMNIVRTIAITIDENILGRIDRLAAKQAGGSANRSQIIRNAVQEYLGRIERLAEEERENQIFKKHRGRLARQAAALVKEQARS